MEVTKKLKLKHLISKVLKGLHFLEISKAYTKRADYLRIRDIDDEESETETTVPEGFFAVIAMQGEETKRFVLELDYLRNPHFMKLLEQAKDEYGYQQKGAIALPCKPQELQKIIENRHSDAL
ncbi:putative small auxin-up RNA [Medicago truncatula]|uniref:Putative small auxin-up RNA n=1 Tax=Medicago truncatula TaxID=3880 RepID=A0A072U2U1_MEDTR|nr:auxin-responsive protein SAUR32 [Medicago truncatula]KEH24027.1 SAUR-like auxin-responsive family protein [Medicago truncatula]RHN48511.1 putative small auxin-up RNA [Medicago truncatula]